MNDEIAGFFIDGWYVFDNFAPFQIMWRGKTYPTAEHAYQASKFLDSHPDLAEQIRLATSPYEAFQLGSVKSKGLNDADWYNSGKAVAMMSEIVRTKYDQHEYVREILVKTDNLTIVEMNGNDSFWGWGSDYNGRNELGKIWMKLRSEI